MTTGIGKRWIKWLIYSFGIFLSILILFFLLVYWGAFGHIPGKEELRSYEQYKATQVFSQQGELIGNIYVENRSDLKFADLPVHVINALVVTEDARFYDHKGIDVRSLFRVLVKSVLLGQEAGGGSTITQQLAKNMYGRKRLGIFTTPVAKIREIIIARRLEKVFTKDQVMTLYLNQVPFGENIFGIESASHRFFNKKAHDLKLEESAVLIGMLRANTLYNPRLHPDNSLIRRNVVLSQMARYDHITDHISDSLAQLPLKLDYTNLDINGSASYFLVQVQKEAEKILAEINKDQDVVYDLKKDGLSIKTTLNTTAQNAVLEAFRKHLSVMQKRLDHQYDRWGKRQLNALVDKALKKSGLQSREEVREAREYFSWDSSYTDTLSVRDSFARDMTMLHAGLIGLDPTNGAIRTWIGGIDFTTWPYDQILAKRQLASTFKPVVYSAALEAGTDPCERLPNNSIAFKEDEPDWNPVNYDRSTGGSYSMNGALVKSVNLPTVQLYRNTGYDEVRRTWINLGFKSHLPEGLSAALGTANASLVELAVAFAAFGNGGYRVKPYMIESIKTRDGKVIYQKKVSVRTKIFSIRTCDLMNHFLGNVIAYGTGSSLRSSYGVHIPLSGKTGTSQNYSDAWFVAYNPRIVLATRVGANSPRIHFTGSLGSGSHLALPLVGIALRKVQNTATGKRWSVSFPELSEEDIKAVDCLDYQDDTIFQKWSYRLRKKDRTRRTRWNIFKK